MTETSLTPWRDRGRLSNNAWHLLFWSVFVVVGLLQRLITSEGIAVLLPVAGLGVLWLLWTGLPLGVLAALAPLSALVAVSLIADVPTTVWVPSSLGTLAQILVSVALLRRWCGELWGVDGRADLESVRTLVLALTALVAGALAAPVLIVPLVALGDPLSTAGAALVMGRQLCGAVLVVLPALLIARAASRRPPRRRAGDEGGLLELTGVAAASTAVFTVSFGPVGLPLAFALLVPAAWCALRFSTAIATLHAVIVSVAVMTVSLLHAGPFGEARETATSALLAQLFVVVVVIAAMTLAIGRDERRELLREVLRAQQGAVRERNLLTTVIDQMHEGVVVLDGAGGVVMHNPAAARFYDFDAQELLYQPHDAQGRRLERAEFPSSRALRGEETVQTLTMRPRADEPDVVAEVAAIPLPEHVDGPSRALLVIRDITAEHQQRMELTAFAGVVAHDLRNPLAAIDGWVGLLAAELEDGGEPPRALVDDAVTRVGRASERMRSLIRHLLQHATSRDAALELGDVDVTAMARSVVTDRGAEASVEVLAVPTVVADPGMLRQLMENLIGNALKYVPPGEQPHVSVDGVTLPGGRVEVRVTDAGVGIPDDEKSLVFQQFYRAHAKGYAGTGLGLAICRRIVDRHGGVIEVRDNPEGRGTQIAFTLAGALTSVEGGRPVQS